MSALSSKGMRLAIKIVPSGRDQNTDLMNFIFTKNIGRLLLAIYLIVIASRNLRSCHPGSYYRRTGAGGRHLHPYRKVR